MKLLGVNGNILCSEVEQNQFKVPSSKQSIPQKFIVIQGDNKEYNTGDTVYTKQFSAVEMPDNKGIFIINKEDILVKGVE